MLQIGLYDTADQMLWDLTARASGLAFSSGEHGFHDLRCFYRCSLTEAFQLYDRPGLPRVYVTADGYTVWAGRLEDVSIVPGGVRLRAFGFWRALSDYQYTELWSTTSVAGWVPVPNEINTAYNEGLYDLDNNNRLYIAPRKGSTVGNTTSQKRGALMWAFPHLSTREITNVAFDFNCTTGANWTAELLSYDWDPTTKTLGFLATEWTQSGTGSGSASVTLSNTAQAIVFSLRYAAADVALTIETGTVFARFTNLRVKTTTSSSIYASEIAAHLITTTEALNAGQLSTATALVQSPGLDLRDELYFTETPADILTRLAGLGDDQTPPRQWEATVWEDRVLRYQPKGTDARTWYVDITALELERSLNLLVNAAEAVYREASGRKLRTSVSTDSDSVARYGLTRRRAVNTQTTSSTLAGKHRDAYLEDNAEPKPQARISFDQLYDAAGNRVPNWMGRAGDTVVIRNLQPTLSADIDRLRTFRSSFAQYDAATNRISFTPEAFLAGLDTQVANLAIRQGAAERGRVIER